MPQARGGGVGSRGGRGSPRRPPLGSCDRSRTDGSRAAAVAGMPQHRGGAVGPPRWRVCRRLAVVVRAREVGQRVLAIRGRRSKIWDRAAGGQQQGSDNSAPAGRTAARFPAVTAVRARRVGAARHSRNSGSAVPPTSISWRCSRPGRFVGHTGRASSPSVRRQAARCAGRAVRARPGAPAVRTTGQAGLTATAALRTVRPEPLASGRGLFGEIGCRAARAMAPCEVWRRTDGSCEAGGAPTGAEMDLPGDAHSARTRPVRRLREGPNPWTSSSRSAASAGDECPDAPLHQEAQGRRPRRPAEPSRREPPRRPRGA
jgi:hypothetical protein